MLWLALLTKVLQESLKFNYVCTNFLNKTSGQTWSKKSQINYNLEQIHYDYRVEAPLGSTRTNSYMRFAIERGVPTPLNITEERRPQTDRNTTR